MGKAVLVRAHGGPEVLSYEDRELRPPGHGEITIRHRAIGLNFIDTYHRSGLYPMPLPFVAGNEGAGDVTAVGEGVTDIAVGDRVTYAGPPGSYAEERTIPAGRVAPIPDDVSYEVAAAITLKGITAYYLIFQTWPLKAGETILFHAAAGGVGSIVTPWAKALGARVIATAGSPEKLAMATALGADHVIDYRTEDFAKRVREITAGRGVDVVYDGVGKDTFSGSLDSLRPRGLMVSFGNASGPVSVPDLGILARKGSLYLTRPTTGSYMATTEEFRTAVRAVFDALRAGSFEVQIGQRFGLHETQAAHRALENRNTTGSTVILP